VSGVFEAVHVDWDEEVHLNAGREDRAEVEAGRKNTDDGVGAIADGDGLADELRVRVELLFPEAVAEDDGGVAAGVVIYGFVGRELAAEVGLNAERLEKIARCPDPLYRFRLTEASKFACRNCEEGNVCGGVLEGSVVLLKGLESIDFVGGVVDSADAFVACEPDDLLGVMKWERAEQEGVDDAEDDDVGADAEGEDCDDDSSEAWIFDDLAKGKRDIAPKIFEPGNAISHMEALLCGRHIAERDSRLAVRFLFAEALALELIGFEFQVRLDFVREIILHPLAPEHAYASSPLGRACPPRINPMALVSRSHSLVFSTSCSRPFAVSE
jgi:hypothetical protein